ncbi:MAG: ankyrin repeat domain-containing protein [Limnobacter sp.]|nr:ankyrin repeat domain-containing protein [Limnobacter sp.]
MAINNVSNALTPEFLEPLGFSPPPSIQSLLNSESVSPAQLRQAILDSVFIPQLQQLEHLIQQVQAQSNSFSALECLSQFHQSDLHPQFVRVFSEVSDALVHQVQDVDSGQELGFTLQYVQARAGLPRNADQAVDFNIYYIPEPRLDLIRFGVLQLKQISALAEFALTYPTKVEANSTPMVQRVLKNLISDLTVCGPGVLSHIENALDTLKLGLFSPSLRQQYESLKLEIFKQKVLDLVRIHQAPQAHYYINNEIHYVHAWQNQLADTFNLPKVVDPYAATDFSSDIQLQSLIQAQLTPCLTFDVILFQVAEVILQELTLGLNSVQNSPDQMLYQKLSTPLEKLKIRLGDLPIRALASEADLLLTDGKLTVDASLIFRHLFEFSRMSSEGFNHQHHAAHAVLQKAVLLSHTETTDEGPVQTFWVTLGAANWVEKVGSRGLMESRFIDLSDLVDRWLDNPNEVGRGVSNIQQHRDLFAISLLNTPPELRAGLLARLSTNSSRVASRVASPIANPECDSSEPSERQPGAAAPVSPSQLSSLPHAKQFALGQLIKFSNLSDPDTRREIKNYFLSDAVDGLIDFLDIQSKYQMLTVAQLRKLIYLLPTEFSIKALYTCIRHRDVNVVRALGQAAPHLFESKRGQSGVAALALLESSVEVLKVLLEINEVCVNHPGDLYRVPLHQAALFGKVDMVKCLLSSPSIAVNFQDQYRATALHLAAYNGHMEVVQLLLAHRNIEVNIQDRTGLTPINLAVYCLGQSNCDETRSNRLEIVKTLIEPSGVCINTPGEKDRSPLTYAISKRDVELAKALLQSSTIKIDAFGQVLLIDMVLKERVFDFAIELFSVNRLTNSIRPSLLGEMMLSSLGRYPSEFNPTAFSRIIQLMSDQDFLWMSGLNAIVLTLATVPGMSSAVTQLIKRLHFMDLYVSPTEHRGFQLAHALILNDDTDSLSALLDHPKYSFNWCDVVGQSPLALAQLLGRVKCANLVICSNRQGCTATSF